MARTSQLLSYLSHRLSLFHHHQQHHLHPLSTIYIATLQCFTSYHSQVNKALTHRTHTFMPSSLTISLIHSFYREVNTRGLYRHAAFSHPPCAYRTFLFPYSPSYRFHKQRIQRDYSWEDVRDDLGRRWICMMTPLYCSQ